MNQRTYRLSTVLVVVLLIGTVASPGGVAARTSAAGTDPTPVVAANAELLASREVRANYCSGWLIASSDYVVPGWYPAAEAVTMYTVGAIATYLWGRLTRLVPPWWVNHGAGALWAAIEASWLSGQLQAGDRMIQYTYEDCNSFNNYFYHYRNGVLIRSTYREIGKSSCKAQNDFVRGIMNGTIQVTGARSKYIFCPNSYGR